MVWGDVVSADAAAAGRAGWRWRTADGGDWRGARALLPSLEGAQGPAAPHRDGSYLARGADEERVRKHISPDVARFNCKHGLPDMPGLGSDANHAKRYIIWDDDEHLLGLVPEHHNLIRVIRHAYSYGANSCYYMISSHDALLYIIKIFFS